MALFDVLKYDGPNNVLVWKWRPEDPSSNREEELRLGTQLVVNQSQKAVFVKDGRVADIFEPGRYTLSSNNLPILSNLISLPFGGQSPFKAEVFFFNMSVSMDTKFGLVPFNMVEPNFKVPIPVTSRGSFAVRIADVSTFLHRVIGTVPDFDAHTLKQFFRGVLSENVKSAIAHIAREQNLSPLELESIVQDVSRMVESYLRTEFSGYGLELEMFNIEAIPVIDEDPRVKKLIDEYQRLMAEDMQERLRLRRRAENLEVYKVERTFDTTEAAANNLGGGSDGGAGSILGTMVGLGMVQPIGNTISNMVGNMATNVNSGSVAAPASDSRQSKEEIFNLLKELGELKEAGILTEDEFAAKKKELLSRI